MNGSKRVWSGLLACLTEAHGVSAWLQVYLKWMGQHGGSIVNIILANHNG
jgi:hypothetical protein